MLSPRSKIIILIAGAAVVFSVIIATVFNLWPGGKSTPDAPPVDLSFLKKDEALPEGQVFDASNRDQFAALMGAADPASQISPLEKQARDLSEFFVERFGTYSSDAGNAHVDDVLSFMTATMRAWAENFKANAPKRDSYFAATAEVAAAEYISFSAPERRAQFALITNRTETINSKTEAYRQKATIELKQDQSGEWKVNSLFWGDKL
ncbi:MAG: hypothetical protein Q8L21_00420 [Candidatus Komeilibacteria bacterium]|nr:hypothetical protein [Candidatus Komeilibacteria bacterium]